MNPSAISNLLTEIGRSLNRGAVSSWTDYDFEVLSDDIFAKTGTRLSVTTLKRVWGRIKYKSTPSTTTLNALAQYAGYADWRSARQETGQDDVPITTTGASTSGNPQQARHPDRPVRWWILGGSAVLCVGALTLLLPWLFTSSSAPVAAAEISLSNAPIIDTANYAFSSRKVKTEGVPNSVVFQYQADSAAGKFPVRISQSWDTARSVVVSAYDSVHSSQYFYPGFFNAKLLVGNQVVQSHNLHITAPDWVGAIHRPNTPVYLAPASFRDNDTLVVNEEMLQEYNIALEPELPEIRLYKVPDLPAISSDDFSFETTLRSDYNAGSGACQAINVLLLLKNDAIIVPLRAEGCTGNTSLFALGTSVRAATADLSGFGTNLSNWTRLTIEGRDRQLRFLVNNQPALTMTVNVDPKDIIGVSIRLQGPGRVRETILRGSGYVVEL